MELIRIKNPTSDATADVAAGSWPTWEALGWTKVETEEKLPPRPENPIGAPDDLGNMTEVGSGPLIASRGAHEGAVTGNSD